ncbi:phage tail tube protein [Nocardiopsis synnemataformans]|uniref:phage tail tube protein n=1 Tax=Nocardiopsis synnemataformans TaxID=61305 RepID=UPI003EBC20EA
MAMHQVNARDIIIQASDGAPTTPTWVEVGGLLTATINTSENEEVADTTTMDSNGYYSQDRMQTGATLTMEGRLLKDSETGELDPGQAQITTNAGGDKLGVNSHAMYRFRYPMDDQWTVWDATTSRGESGGGHNEKVSFNAVLTRSGPSTTEAVA